MKHIRTIWLWLKILKFSLVNKPKIRAVFKGNGTFSLKVTRPSMGGIIPYWEWVVFGENTYTFYRGGDYGGTRFENESEVAELVDDLKDFLWDEFNREIDFIRNTHKTHTKTL